MEKKTRLWIILASLLLAAALGAALRLARTGHERPIKGSGLSNREVEEIERSLAAASGRIEEAIGGACEEAGGLTARERSTLERDRAAAGQARDLANGLEGIGENADGAARYLDELASLLAELQRRSQGASP